MFLAEAIRALIRKGQADRTRAEKAEAALSEERAHADRLADVAEERDGGAHDPDCKIGRIWSESAGYCTCGHVEMTTALAAHKKRREG